MKPYMLDSTIKDIPLEWRCKHDNGIKAEPGPYICWQCTADDAFALYDKVNMAYRNGEPVMDDWRFDVFEKMLRDKYPDDKRFWQVGETSEKR